MSREFFDCKHVGCDRVVKARGYCQLHYTRSRKGHDMDAPVVKRTTSWAEALAERTEWQGECLVWTGHTQDAGHGVLNQGGVRVLVHRAAWLLAGLPLEENQVLDHKCHNPPCVNVKHLRAVTQRENIENRAGANKNNVTGYRGVSWNRRTKSFIAQVRSNGKSYVKHGFLTPETANEAAIAMRKNIFGEVTV